MQHVCAELAWLSRLLSESQVNDINQLLLMCDDMVVIHIVINSVFHERTKHIETNCHFMHEKLQEGLISLSRVHTQDKLTDVFTKVLNGHHHQHIISMFGL